MSRKLKPVFFIVSITPVKGEDPRDELAGSLEDARDSGLIDDFEIIEQSETDPGRNLEGFV